nr:hypothetical protein [Rhodospirillales bacterium]
MPNNQAQILEKLADNHERLLGEALVEFEKSIVDKLTKAPLENGKLFDLRFALGMRKSLHQVVQKEVLSKVNTMINDFDIAEKSLLDMYGELDIDKALLTVDRSIVKQLKKLTFQGFEDVANTFIDSIGREIYQNTLTGKPLSDSIRSVQQQINGVYIQTNDAEAQELVEFIAEHKHDPSKQGAVDSAVEKLHTKYARDRVGNNLRRYASQQLHDGLMQYSASINMQMADQLGADKFKYYGTVVGGTRKWCKDHIGKVMSKDEIRDEWASNSWAGKSSSDPFIARGGYNCRHHWRAVFDEDAVVDEVVEDKPVNEFVPAKNKRQAELFAINQGVKDVSFKGVTLEDANAINKSLAAEIEKGGLDLSHMSNKMTLKGAYMEASASGKFIHFSPKALSDITFGDKNILESRMADYKSGVQSLNKMYAEATDKKLKARIYGKISDYEIEIEILKEKAAGGDLLKWGAQEFAQTREDAVGMIFRHETGHLRFGKLPSQTKERIKEIFKSAEFSTEYSKTNPEEYFAESFSLFRYGHKDKVDDKLLKILEEI